MRSVAIMQPYLFPYLGYFQLAYAADLFLFLDDVNFMKGAWIQRNQIYSPDGTQYFQVPLVKISQNRMINEIAVFDERGWRDKFRKQFSFTYAKAPYFEEVFPLVEAILETRFGSIAEMAEFSVKSVFAYLDMTRQWGRSSDYDVRGAKGEERILNLCVLEKAERYINPIGGTKLYTPGHFIASGIDLKFIKMRPYSYTHLNGAMDKTLSILDVLMFNSAANVRALLKNYDLVSEI